MQLTIKKVSSTPVAPFSPHTLYFVSGNNNALHLLLTDATGNAVYKSLDTTDVSSLVNTLLTAYKGADNGIASLDENGQLPVSQLPGIIIEIPTYSALPAIGRLNAFYFVLDSEYGYIWNGTAYQTLSVGLNVTGVTPGTYTKLTVDAYGRATVGGALIASDIPTLNQDTTGNAATATTLETGRTIGMTGDVTWSTPAFDGSSNVTATATLANSGVAAGTYTKVTVDTKGRVTTGSSLAASDIPTLNQNTTGTAANVTGTVAIANGGTGATTASNARTNLGATTVGSNLFTLNNVTNTRYIKINGDNTITLQDSNSFLSSIGGGTVNSVGLSLPSMFTVTGSPVTTSGTLTAALASQTAKFVLAAPNAANGTPSFRALVASDIPLLNQNTTGSAATLATARKINNVAFDGSADIVIPSVYDNSFTRIVNPGGAVLNSGSVSVTGALRITLPVGFVSSMIQIDVKVYNYPSQSFDIHLDGYLYATGPTWHDAKAYLTGPKSVNVNYPIRFGMTSGNIPVVYIGHTDTVWSYPKAYVTLVTVGHSGQSLTWTSGWSIDIVAALETVQITELNPQLGYAVSTNTANSYVLRDITGSFSAGTITASLAGNASTATTLQNGRTIGMTGDVTWTTPAFNGSSDVTATATLADSGIPAGTYNNNATTVRPFTIDAKGRVTAAPSAITITPAWSNVTSKPTTISGYAISDAYTKTEVDSALDAKQDTIVAGTTAQYYRGDKTWQDLYTQVRNATLTGLSTATNAAITAADTVLAALGKIQAQITGHIGSTGSAHGVVTTSVNGFMSTTDKAKLDGIATGATANTGTVTSVGLIVPSIMSVSGSPVTTTGTFNVSLVSQTANTFLAAPNAANGTPTFRAIVATDIPVLNQSTTGNAATASTLQNSRSITMTGDGSWTVSFNGGASVSSALTLASSGVIANTYNNSATAITPITVDAKGRITATGSAVTITPAWSSVTGKPTTIGASGITDVYTESEVDTLLSAKENTSNKGVANGYASLDATGKVPSTQLPSFVDDVLEYANYAALPATGESGKIYVLATPYTASGITSSQFRWSGTAYAAIIASPGTTDAVTEGSVNLYFTSARASSAAPVQSVAGKTGTVTLVKADVGLGNVDNTSDTNKPVSSAQQTALNAKENSVASGTTSQYYRGDKSWQDLFTQVRATTLTGLSTAANAAITATDTVLVALGKVQAQLTGHIGGTGTSHGVVTNSVNGFMSTADKIKLDAIATGATANTGTVTSVGLSMPSMFTVTGSPVTTSGTLTAALASQTAKFVLAAPNAANGVPTFRALIASDIPVLNQNTTGNAATATTLETARNITVGGTTKTFNGGSDLSFTHTEMGVEARQPMSEPRSNLGSPTVREAALFEAQFNNKIAYYPITSFFLETSTDRVTWSAFSLSDTEKKQLVGGHYDSDLTIPNGTAYFRIRIRSIGYVYLNDFYSFISFNGHSSKIKIYKKHDSGSWENHAVSETGVSGWPAHVYIPTNNIPFSPTATLGSHYHEVSIEFQPSWNATYPSNGINIYKVEFWGGYPGGKRVIYTEDENKNVAFPAAVSAIGFTGPLTGNASTASALQTARTISSTGDVSWSTSFTGSANVTGTATLANSGVAAGTYTKVTVDSKGRVTTGASLAAGDVPTLNQNTTGSAATLANTRTFTIGNTSRNFNGSANVSWTTTEIGAVNRAGDTISGVLNTEKPINSNGSVTGYKFINNTTVQTWKLAKLPISTVSTNDVLQITGTIGAWTTTKHSLINIVAKKRDSFSVQFYEGSGLGNNGIEFYLQADGSVDVYLALRDSYMVSTLQLYSNNVTVYPDPSIETPTGTLVTSSQSATLASRDISVSGNANTATTLQNGRTIGMTGDVSWTSPAFNGGANITAAATLANSGVAAGTYTKVTVDTKGRVTTGSSLAAGDIPTLNQNTTGSAATLTTARNITVGSSTKTFNGSSDINFTTTEMDLMPSKLWTAQVTVGTWSRICLTSVNALGGQFVFGIGHTRNSVVVNVAFQLYVNHSNGVGIYQIASGNYTQIQIRTIQADANNVYVEILDTAVGSGLFGYTVRCTSLDNSTVLPITTYTAGSGTASSTLTTQAGGYKGDIIGNATNVTGTVAIANGGTGATTAAAARTNLGATTVGGNFYTLTNPSAVSFVRINADNTVSSLNAADFRTAIGAGTSSTVGTVTSVGLSMPNIFTVTNSPVTNSGTLTASLNNQSGNTVFAAPSGSTGAPSFRQLVAADIPSLDAAKITSGRFASERLPLSGDASAIKYNLDIGTSTGLNTLGTSGFYRIGNTPTDAPAGVAYGQAIVSRWGDTILQIVGDYQNTNLFFRSSDGASVSGITAGTPWRKLISDLNIGNYAPSLTGASASGTWAIDITGTAAAFASAKSIAITGDATWSVSFSGAADVSAALTLANSGVAAGTYTKVAVDAKGRVTAGSSLASGDIPSLNQYVLKSSAFAFFETTQYGPKLYPTTDGTMVTGGWARAYGLSPGSTSTKTAGFGAYGSGDSINYIYANTTNDYASTNSLRIGASSISWGTNPILHSGNYGTYAPSLTGSGASGNWGINVTGSAATLTNARTLTVGNTGKTFNGSANVSWSLEEMGVTSLSIERSLNVTTTNWVTIATCATGRAYGDFYIYDTDSGKHNICNVTASTSYGQNSVSCVSGNRYTTRSIAHVRILYNNADRTYGGAKLQVYCENPSFVLRYRASNTDRIVGWDAWTLITPVVEGTPAGWVEDSTARVDDVTNSAYHFVGKLLGSATTLETGRTIAMTGDVSWTSPAFNGSTNVTATATLANSGVVAGTYNNSATTNTPLTVDAKGRVTATGAAVTITPAWSNVTGKPTTIGASGITDVYTKTETDTLLNAKENTSNKGVANGYASLDATGKVPSTQLPSFVDDVLEFTNFAALPATGESGKIYVLETPYTSAGITSSQFRWSGTVYVPIIASPGTTDAVTEGSVNLYFTTARAASAAPVQSVAGKTGTVTLVKADVGLGSVDNTSDANKPVSTAQQTALNLKENSVASGTTAQYYRGDKSWQDLFTQVRATTLTGLSTATNSAVAATDTVLVGVGKLQAQVTGHIGSGGASHANATTSVAGFMSGADKTKLDGIAAGATANTGTVTSVALSLPNIFTVSGSPVTTTGTLTATLASQTAGTVLAAPSGAAGVPTFRAIVASDIPTLNQSTTGSAATLTTGATIGMTGDVTWTSAIFNGSANVTGVSTLANSGVTAGTYTKVTVDAKGRVTTGASLVAGDVPVLNQNTTGSAATLTTARTINGVSFNGSSNIVVPTIYDQDFVRILNPQGAVFNHLSASVTGAIAITLPVGFTASMIQMTVKVYNYSGISFTVNIHGYLYQTGPTWHGARAYITSFKDMGVAYPVRFGMKAGNIPVIYIGDTTTAWSYPKAYVTEVYVGHVGQSLAWTTGWNIAMVTAFETVQITESSPLTDYSTSTNIAGAIVLRDVSGSFSAGIITASLSGNATTATALQNGRTIGMTGDVTWTSASFNGSANVTGTATLANSGVTAGTYGKVTVDAKGRVTAGTSLLASDIPTLNQNTTGTASNVTGVVAIANGGTGATTAAAARTNLGATTVGANLFTLNNVTNIRYIRINADNTITLQDASSFINNFDTGTVKSVGLSLPSIFTVSGSPVTTTGTLTATLASQTAGTVLAAPSGAAGVPTFRAIVASDIPTLNQSTTGSASAISNTSVTDANSDRGVGFRTLVSTTGATNFPLEVGVTIEARRASGSSSDIGTFQIFSDTSANENYSIRKVNGYTTADTWSSWRTLLHSGNYNTFAPSLTGIGASGTWTININGNATSLGSVSSDNYVRGVVAAGVRTPSTTQTLTEEAQWKAGFWDVSGATWAPDSSSWYWGATFAHRSNSNSYIYGSQLAFKQNTNSAYIRSINAGTASAWTLLLTNDNVSTVAVTKNIDDIKPSKLTLSPPTVVWSQTTPGVGTGALHVGSASAVADSGHAITFGARDSGLGLTAQAGIYVVSGGSYGTKMFLATTDNYSTGAKNAIAIDNKGNVNLLRGNLKTNGFIQTAGPNAFTRGYSGGYNTTHVANTLYELCRFTISTEYQNYTLIGELRATTGENVPMCTFRVNIRSQSVVSSKVFVFDKDYINSSGQTCDIKLYHNTTTGLVVLGYLSATNAILNPNWEIKYITRADIDPLTVSSAITVLSTSGLTEVSVTNSTPKVMLSTLQAPTFIGSLQGNADSSTTLYSTNNIQIVNPANSSYITTTASVTGALSITFPVGFINLMVRLTVKVYNYATNTSFEAVIAGYTYSDNTWTNCTAYIVGSQNNINSNFTVRYSKTTDATPKPVIYIGENNTAWAYPQVFITDIQIGYAGYTNNAVRSDWIVGFTTSMQTALVTVSNAKVGVGYSTNTASTLVTRDASGNFSAGTITASLSGNASTATELTNFTSTTTTTVTFENAKSAVSYVNSASIFPSVTDGALYSHVYSATWKHQIYGDYRSGQIALRGKNNGTWQAWRTVVDSVNVATYAVDLSTVQTITSRKTYTAQQTFYSSATTTEDDHQNSPISIRERGMAGAGTGADKEAPNLNFHWSNRQSNSLWMDSTGALNYGSYSSTGVPEGSNGHIKAGALTLNSSSDNALILNKAANGGGIGILFSDLVPGYTQSGSLKYYHADASSFGSANAFVVESTEPSTSFVLPVNTKLIPNNTNTGELGNDTYTWASARIKDLNVTNDIILHKEYPDVRPSLLLDFGNSESINTPYTFSRNTSAFYYDGKTYITGDDNIFLYSDAISNSYWTKRQVTVAANAGIVSPDNTTTTWTLTNDTTSNNHGISASGGRVNSGVPYTASIYAKAGTIGYLQILMASGTTIYANFNLLTGVLGTVGSGCTATITNSGNGWYRCSMTVASSPNITSNAIYFLLIQSATDARNPTYVGTTSQTLHLAGAQLENRTSMTRLVITTASPIRTKQALMIAAKPNKPRFNHDPVTRECLGYLSEGMIENKCLETEDFSVASHVKFNVTAVANSAVSPDGNVSSYLIYPAATNTAHSLTYSFVTDETRLYTASIFVKSAGITKFGLYLRGDTDANQTYCNVDLATGVIYDRGVGGTITNTATTNSAIYNLGNGWYRVCVTGNLTSGIMHRVQIFQRDDAGNSTFLGDPKKGLFIFGMQIEKLYKMSSYIKRTTGLSGVRGNDVFLIDKTDSLSLFNTDELTAHLLVRYDDGSELGADNRYALSIRSESNYQRVLFFNSSITGNSCAIMQYDGSTKITHLSAVTSDYSSIVLGYKYGQASASSNTNSLNFVTDIVTGPEMNYIEIGQSGNMQHLFGHIKKIAIYPKKLSDAAIDTIAKEI